MKCGIINSVKEKKRIKSFIFNKYLNVAISTIFFMGFSIFLLLSLIAPIKLFLDPFLKYSSSTDPSLDLPFNTTFIGEGGQINTYTERTMSGTFWTLTLMGYILGIFQFVIIYVFYYNAKLWYKELIYQIKLKYKKVD